MSKNSIDPVDIEFVLKNINFQQEAEKMKAGIRGISTTAQQEAAKTNEAFRQMATGVGVYFSAAFMKQFVMEVVNVRGEFQQLGIAFEVMLGSKEKADRLMQEAVAFSQKTPFTLTDVATNIKQLLAMGIATEKVMGTMKALGDVAAGVSVPISRVAINYGQVAVLGKLQEREIRDFAMAGIPLIDELAKNLGKSKEEIKEMVTASQIGFPEVEKAFETMSSVGGRFYDLMQKQNAAVTGQISNLADKWQVMLNSIGEANEGLIYGSITGLSTLIANYEDVLDVLKVMVVTYGIYKTASIAVAIADGYAAAAKAANAGATYALIGRTTQLTFAQYASAKAQGVVNSVMAINPYVLAATAIAALVTALVVFSDTAAEAAEAQQQINDLVNDEKAKITRLIIEINAETTANADRAKALRELNNLLPAQVGLLDAQTLSTQAGKKAIDDYIDSVRKRAEMELLTARLKKNLDEQDRVASGDLNFGESFILKWSGGGINDWQREQSKLIFGLKEEEEAIKKQMESVMKKTDTQKDGNETKHRTIELINEEIEAEKKLQEKSTNRKEFDEAQKVIDRLEAEKKAITGAKDKTKEVQGEYNKLEAAIKKASDAVVNANEKERPALQEKLGALVKQRMAWEDIIKAQRGEVTDIKPIKLITRVDSDPIKVSALEVEKLGKKVEKAGIEAAKLKSELKFDPGEIDLLTESFQKQSDILAQSVAFMNEMLAAYGEQLGLSEDQQKVLEGGMNAMKGMAQIASGDVIGGAMTLIATTAEMFIKTPEKLSEQFENINDNIQKVISSLATAEQSLANMGKSGFLTSLKVIKAEMLDLAEDAKTLNDELAKSSTGRRRAVNSNLPGTDLVRQAADLNVEIEKLSNRLLQGDISDEQRKAIEALLKSYNGLLGAIDGTIQDITGTTVSDLSRGLADAFLSGEDAAEAWGAKVDDIIKNIITRQLTAQLLTAPITEAVNTLVNDSGDGLSVEEAEKFKTSMDLLYSTTGPAFEAVQKSLQAAGFNFNTSSSAKASGLTGSVRGATEETVGAMVGQLMAVRIDIKSILTSMAAGQDDVAKNLFYLKEIAQNTSHNKELLVIRDEMKEMNRTLKDRL